MARAVLREQRAWVWRVCGVCVEVGKKKGAVEERAGEHAGIGIGKLPLFTRAAVAGITARWFFATGQLANIAEGSGALSLTSVAGHAARTCRLSHGIF